MIMVNSVEAVADLLALADEIAREEHIPFKTAVVRAEQEQASLCANADRGVRYRLAMPQRRTSIGHWHYRPAKVWR